MQDSLSPGKVLADRFRIERSINLGGWGEVYRGLDLETGKPVAIKRTLALESLNDESEGRYAHRRFLEEVKVLQTLDFPGIPKCLSSFSLPDNRHCLVMEYIDGVDLERQVQDQLKLAGELLPAANAVEYIIQACIILEHLHSLKPHPIIHRDVKPSNLILRHLDHRIYLVDFGFARPVGPSVGNKTMVGTIGYAPIEQCQGNPSPLSDLYAVGATLHYLLTGKQPTPFDIEPLDRSRKELPASLVQAVATATRNEKEQRYPSVESFRRELERILPELGARQPPVSLRDFTDHLSKLSDTMLESDTEEMSELPTAVARAKQSSAAVEPPALPPTRPLSNYNPAETQETLELREVVHPRRKPALPRSYRWVIAALLLVAVSVASLALWRSTEEINQRSLVSDIYHGWDVVEARGLSHESRAGKWLRLARSDGGILSFLNTGPSGFVIRQGGDNSVKRLVFGLEVEHPTTLWILLDQENQPSCAYRLEHLGKPGPLRDSCNFHKLDNVMSSEFQLQVPRSQGSSMQPLDEGSRQEIVIPVSRLRRMAVILEPNPSDVLLQTFPLNN